VRNRVDKYKSLRKKKRKGFHGTKQPSIIVEDNVERPPACAETTLPPPHPSSLEPLQSTTTAPAERDAANELPANVSVMHKNNNTSQYFLL